VHKPIYILGDSQTDFARNWARQVASRPGDYQLDRAENLITFNVGGSTTICASFVVGVGS